MKILKLARVRERGNTCVKLSPLTGTDPTHWFTNSRKPERHGLIILDDSIYSIIRFKYKMLSLLFQFAGSDSMTTVKSTTQCLRKS